MTNQEAFDTVARHLLQQGERSLANLGETQPQCRLRGAGGTKCALGALIPDDAYDPVMELDPVGTVYRLCEGRVWDSLLKSLQRCHDDHEPAQWPHVLRGLAAHYGLDPGVLK